MKYKSQAEIINVYTRKLKEELATLEGMDFWRYQFKQNEIIKRNNRNFRAAMSRYVNAHGQEN